MDFAETSRSAAKTDLANRPRVTTGGLPALPAAAQHDFLRSYFSGCNEREQRWVAAEVPIGIEINGIGYAVLLAKPGDIPDLVIGFAMADRIVGHPRDILDMIYSRGPRI